MSTQIWNASGSFYVVDADHDGNAWSAVGPMALDSAKALASTDWYVGGDVGIAADITDQPHVVISTAPAVASLNAAEFEITDGYVGSFGVTFKLATAETLAAAIEKAAAMHDTTVLDIEVRLTGGATVRWCESPNYYYDHGYGVIRRKRTPQPVKLVRCSCGHSVPAAQVMSASLGTSCPDCYDRMSD